LTPLFTASTLNAQVGQSIEFAADPTRVLFDPAPQWDMGNGVHLTGSQVAYAYPAAGSFPVILTASDLACGETRLSAPVTLTVTEPEPPTCNFEGVPEHLQWCCGDGTCQGGENPDQCPGDCPPGCPDGHCSVTHGENPQTCPTDCCLSGTVCAAGCAPIPSFSVSNPQPGRFQEVTFTANENQVLGSTVNWDFGDGQHCEGCPLTVTHAYELQGSYQARLTITESVCGSTQVSMTVAVNVGPAPPKPWAQIVESGLPGCLAPQTAVAAWVRVRNIGGTRWHPDTGEVLRLLYSDDPYLFTPLDVPIPSIVPPGAEVVFRFNFGTVSATTGEFTVKYGMVNNFFGGFGDEAVQRVSVRAEGCGAAPEPGDYTCRASLRTTGGDPAPNVRVRLDAYFMGEESEYTAAGDEDLTNADGIAYLATSRPGVPITRVSCRFVGINTTIAPEETLTHPTEVPIGSHIVLDRTLNPAYERQMWLPGLRGGDGVARLYQSGSYDKPVVIPTPFDVKEQTGDARTDELLREDFEPFLRAAHQDGFDVWILRTRTGQNIHEQAAEFAQLIDGAARPLGPEGKVIVAGYSLGGVTARLSTARYQADPDWRIALGVRPTLPVSLIAFGDAPLLGANIQYDVQRALWTDLAVGGETPFVEGNLNSCGAQQLLRRSYPTDRMNYERFWYAGQEIEFNRHGAHGVCDRREGVRCICDAGPAVVTVNGDGWAHGIPIVAFSDGYPGPLACYGGDADRDGRDGSGEDVCEDLGDLFAPLAPSYPFEPWVSTPVFRIGKPKWFDYDIGATPDDVAPGSRIANLKRSKCGGPFNLVCGGIRKQYFSPTFIPFDSALPPGAPFAASWHAAHSGIHGVGVPENIERLLAEMAAVTGGGLRMAALGSGPVSQWPATAGGQAPIEISFPSPDHVPTSPLTLVIDDEGPPAPPGRVHGNPSLYYTVGADMTNVSPASWREPITVCLDYSGTVFQDEVRLALYHREAVGWVDVTSHVDVEARRVCGNATTLATFALFEPLNRAPLVFAGADRVVQATSTEGAEVVIVPSGTHDPDEDAVTYAWRDGDGQLLAEAATLRLLLPPGAHELSLTVNDSRGGEASDTVIVTVTDVLPAFVSEYQASEWSACSGDGSWSCTSAGSTGCSRPGVQSREVTPVAWTDDPSQAAPEPPSSQACTETTAGFASEYQLGAWGACSGTAAWTCTSATATGCSRPGTQARVVSAVSWTASSAAAQPAPPGSQGCTQTAPGYVASYSVGDWSACSATCGGGFQTRSVAPSGYTASGPSAPLPDAVQSCTGESCTCDDMGWYTADQKSQCDSECGAACTKKQWCGSNECEPWPHYCWKC
jgi:hypothetical protein